MTRTSDIDQLVLLRSIREERARTALAIEGARLQESRRALAKAEAVLEAHDLETEGRERNFFEAMRIRPLSENELGRGKTRLLVSEHRREILVAERNEAAEASAEDERRLEAAQAQWRQRLRARDKLAEARARLRLADLLRFEAISEQELEEMNADRAGASC